MSYFQKRCQTIKAGLCLYLATVATVGVHAQSIGVQNSSFETATLPRHGINGPFCQLIPGSTIAGYALSGSVAGWTATSTTKNAGAGIGAASPGGNNWTEKWWTGTNAAWLQTTSAGSASLSQTLPEALKNNMTYTLSVRVGRRAMLKLGVIPIRFDYAIQLWAGNTMLGSAHALELPTDSSGIDYVYYSSLSNNVNAGQLLRIVLTSSGSNGTITEAFFDDVALLGFDRTTTRLLPPEATRSARVIMTGTQPCEWKPAPKGWRAFDLNGIWEATYGKPGVPGYRVERIGLEVEGDSLTASIIGGNPRAGQTFFIALYDSDCLAGGIGLPGNTPDNPNYLPAMMHVEDVNHFRIGEYPQFVRAAGASTESRAPGRGSEARAPGACSTELTNDPPVDGWTAWGKGQQLAEEGNFGDALLWYRRGAAAGNANAAYEAGALYDTGYLLPSTRDNATGIIRSNFVKQDRAEAYCWFQKAVKQGSVRGLQMLSSYNMMGGNLTGNPIGQNIGEAVRLMEVAAQQGNLEAQAGLAQAYLQGRYVARDPEKFVAWAKRAGETRNSFQQKCVQNQERMKELFPALLHTRPVQKNDLLAVWGKNEYVCKLTMPAQEGRRGETSGEADRRRAQNAATGGPIESWIYTITEIPGRPRPDVRRATLGEMAEQAAIRVAQALAVIKQNCGARCAW